MDLDGKNVRQITHELGYDGGAFFSPDGKKIVFRASRFTTEEQRKSTSTTSSKDWWRPPRWRFLSAMLTAPDCIRSHTWEKQIGLLFFHPSGKKIIFSSNHKGTRGFEFNLFMINEDGTGSSKSPTTRSLTRSLCFLPTASRSFFPPTETTAARTTPTCSSPTGWSNAYPAFGGRSSGLKLNRVELRCVDGLPVSQNNRWQSSKGFRHRAGETKWRKKNRDFGKKTGTSRRRYFLNCYGRGRIN